VIALISGRILVGTVSNKPLENYAKSPEASIYEKRGRSNDSLTLIRNFSLD